MDKNLSGSLIVATQRDKPIDRLDPAFPGFVIRENPNGSRERGLFIGRQFYSLGRCDEDGIPQTSGVPITASLGQLQSTNEAIVWKLFERLAILWELSDAEKATLIGTKSEGDSLHLSQAQFERFADLLGIFEALHNLLHDNIEQARYLRRRHVEGALAGLTPLEVMLGSNDGPRRVAEWVLSASQGWN